MEWSGCDIIHFGMDVTLYIFYFPYEIPLLLQLLGGPDYNHCFQPFSRDKPMLCGQGDLAGREPSKYVRVGDQLPGVSASIG